jgi:hypothetical protein
MRGASLITVGVVLIAGASALAGPSAFARPMARMPVEIVSVTALPTATQPRRGPLLAERLNTVTASTALAFRVNLRVQAPSQLKTFTVVLKLDRPAGMGGPLVRQRTVSVGSSGQTQAVTFANFGEVPFASRTDLEVKIPSGPGARYPLIFSLPTGKH